MAILSISDLKARHRPDGRFLGLDMGSKTIGLALSDVNLSIASPMETIRRTKFTADLERLRGIVTEHGVEALVIGLPLGMDGTEGPRCQSVRQFAENILEQMDIPIAFWDERLSTSAVERVLIEEVDMTRKRRKQIIDKAAAAYILQGALDAAEPA